MIKKRVSDFIIGIRRIYSQYIGIRKDSLYGKKGKFSLVNADSSVVPHNMFIDEYCVIQDKTNFISYKGKLYVKKFSVISSGCTIVPSSHLLTVGVPFFLSTTDHINDEDGDVIIDEDCWIGAGCILLPQCHIGRGAVVGAGCVVKKDIPPYAVVVGVPARIVATKFTVDQILKHESILYPPEERMKKSELESLFSKYYQGIKSIGVEVLSEEDNEKLNVARTKFSINDYSSVI